MTLERERQGPGSRLRDSHNRRPATAPIDEGSTKHPQICWRTKDGKMVQPAPRKPAIGKSALRLPNGMEQSAAHSIKVKSFADAKTGNSAQTKSSFHFRLRQAADRAARIGDDSLALCASSNYLQRSPR